MLQANGLYGHIRNNTLKSMWLFVSFVLALEVLWFVIWYALGLLLPVLGYAGLISSSLASAIEDRYAKLGIWAAFGETMHYPLIFGFCWLLIASYFQAFIIRRASGARSLDRREAPRLFNIVENLAMTAGVPMPRVELIEQPALNAYAAGLSPREATIAVTRGLMDTLDARELEAVIAHEISHIRNCDIRLSVVAMVLQGLLSSFTEFMWSTVTQHKMPLADIFMTRPHDPDNPDSAALQRRRFCWFLFWHGLFIAPFIAETTVRGTGRMVFLGVIANVVLFAVAAAWRTWQGRTNAMVTHFGYLPKSMYLLAGLVWPALLMLWGAMVVGGFLAAVCYAMSCKAVGAISRSREFMADAGAVELTKDADALISALLKISGRDHVPGVSSAMRGLMISSGRGGWLATHPSIGERIAALRAYAGATLRADRLSSSHRRAGLGRGNFGLRDGGRHPQPQAIATTLSQQR